MIETKNLNLLINKYLSIVDSLNKEITHISNEDPNELGRLFFKELKTRRQFITDDLIKFYDYPDNFKDLDARRRVPVIGYKSGRYDLLLIKKYLIKCICEKEKIIAAKKDNKYIYWVNNSFLILVMINYVGLGTSLDSFLKIEKVENLKQCFPYKCLKAYQDLDKMYVPKIDDFFNDIKMNLCLKKILKTFVNIMKGLNLKH